MLPELLSIRCTPPRPWSPKVVGFRPGWFPQQRRLERVDVFILFFNQQRIPAAVVSDQRGRISSEPRAERCDIFHGREKASLLTSVESATALYPDTTSLWGGHIVRTDPCFLLPPTNWMVSFSCSELGCFNWKFWALCLTEEHKRNHVKDLNMVVKHYTFWL